MLDSGGRTGPRRDAWRPSQKAAGRRAASRHPLEPGQLSRRRYAPEGWGLLLLQEAGDSRDRLIDRGDDLGLLPVPMGDEEAVDASRQVGRELGRLPGDGPILRQEKPPLGPDLREPDGVGGAGGEVILNPLDGAAPREQRFAQLLAGEVLVQEEGRELRPLPRR